MFTGVSKRNRISHREGVTGLTHILVPVWANSIAPTLHCASKTGPLTYCNKILQEIMKISAIQLQICKAGHVRPITGGAVAPDPALTAIGSVNGKPWEPVIFDRHKIDKP